MVRKLANSRLFILYIVLIIIILGSIGTIIISIVPSHLITIIAFVLVAELIIFLALIYRIFSEYIMPLKSSVTFAEEIAKGNYEKRISVNYYGDIAQLNHSLNMIAISLQDMTAYEKQQDTQLRTVIDNMESGLMMIDDRGYVRLINRAFLNLFRGQDKDYIGFLYYETLANKDIHHVVQKTLLYEEKVKKSFELSPMVDATNRKHLEIKGAPLFDEKQYVKGVVLVFHDITELKRIDQTRKDFVANVSHELKTPITSIRGFAETLIDGADGDANLRAQFLSIILNESQRLQTLVQDLLELSKLDNNEVQLEYSNVNINELIKEILPFIKDRAHHKQIDFELFIESNIEVDGDHSLLQQVFLNLLSNAINYTSNHGKVMLKVTNKANTIQILVADSGIGIPKDMHSRIFERFFRVDRARSRNTGGTGLGLAIVKHIIEAHRGTIEVKSEQDIGTSFIVDIPKKLTE